MRNFTLLLLLTISFLFSFAQPANDACPNAILISNVNNFCSTNGAGSTATATDDVATTGGFTAATCWGGTVNDVWYKFVATATDVSITINGNQGSPVGGTISRPQVALYSGTCAGTINELACGSAPAGQNIIQIYRGGLTIGDTYLIRVDAANANKGTFQYCIDNYNPVPSPNGDCPTAVVLCDKNSFTVPIVIGPGLNNTEMNDAACFGGGTIESNSTWYAFKFATAGTFTFTIVPSNPIDDIDFAVYKLPNGIGNCAGKQVVRCMASAPCPSANSTTTGIGGPTGQYADEYSGCNADISYLFCGIGRCQSQFASQLTVAAGETYAIAINNFSSTGNGFNISFGGTAQFQGPTAIINDSDPDDQICPGEAITYTDASTPPPSGTLVTWTWNFGVGATPATFSGQNPPSVTYSSNGVKTISLTVKSDKGCFVTSTKTITVTNVAPTVSIGASQNPICAGTNVTFTATPSSAGSPPTYQWYLNGNPVGGNTATYSNTALVNGDKIKVTVTSTSACNIGVQATSNIITMTVNAAPTVNVTSPSICSNQTAQPVASGATTYTWTGGLAAVSNPTTPVLTTTTTYTVTGTTSGCTGTAVSTITVKATPVVNVTSPNICNGQTAQPIASGATTYTWTGGLAAVSNPTTPILTTTTTYTVTGTTNGCTATAVSTVTVAGSLNVNVTSPVICSGLTAQPVANGATTYTWTGGLTAISNPTTPALTTTTTYTVTGTTSGCTGTAVATVTVNANPTVNVTSPIICSGQTAQPVASGATSYTWTGGLSAVSNPTTPVLTTTTTYTVTGTTGTCSKTAVSTITVNANPTVNVTSPTICSGKTAQPVASGATSYTWTGGLAAVSNPTTPVLTTTTTYTVTGTTGSCTGTAVSTVTVNANPTVNVTSPSICSGQTAQPIASGATSYTWTGGLSAVSNPTTPILTTTTTYTVTGTTGSCTGTAVATVTVNANPTVIVTSPIICSGQTAQPIASGATSYTWTGGLAAVSNPTTPILTTTTTYTVTGTTGTCSKTAVSTVTVKSTPTVNVTSPIICSGQTAQPIASGATGYTWSGGLAAVSNPNTLILTTTTTYTVTGTTNGCTGTAVSTVTVKPNPNVNVTSPSICSGQTAQPIASGATTYTWTGGLAAISNPTTPALTTTITYTVTGNTNGCTATAVSSVTVKPNPVVNVNNPNICPNQTAALSASGATTYTWTGGLTAVSNPTTPALTTTTTYTVTGTTNGCTGTAVAIVSINPNLIINVNSPSICSGQTAALAANGAANYTWTGGLAATSNPTTPVLTTTTTYTVTGNTSGCTGTAVATVTVNAIPAVNVTSASVCSGQTAQPVASGAAGYTWTGGLAAVSNPTTPVLTTTTTYTVTGTNNGCTGTAVSTVTVKPNPNVSVTGPIICNGQTAQPIASGATSYTWTGGLAAISNPTTAALTTTTIYTVTGTTNGCTGTATSTVTVKPNPNVTVTSPAICGGRTAQPVASGATTYTWTGGLTAVSNPTTPALTTTTTYTVTGTTNGCTGTAVSTVTVTPNPTMVVTSPIICSGQTAQPTASGAASYIWTGGLASVSNPTTPVLTTTTTYTVTGTTNTCTGTAVSTVTVNPTKTTNMSRTVCQGQNVSVGAQTFSATGNYTVVLQTSKGCDSTVNLDLTVSPTLVPAVSIISDKNNICLNDAVVFTATATNTGVTPSYQWQLNDVNVGTNTAQYNSSALANGDAVKVIITTTASCANPTTATSNTINVLVNKVTYTKPPVEYCKLDSQTVNLGIITIPASSYSVKWLNGSNVSTDTTSFYTVTNTGNTNIPFEITFGNNCKVNDVLPVIVDPLPNINATTDIAQAKYEEEVHLGVTTNATMLTYNWTPASVLNSDSIRNPTAIITASTVFTVNVKDNRNCRNTDSVFVELIDQCKSDFIYVPTAFSPNRDGINDCFVIMSPPNLTNYKMVIFDRWGEKVFETTDEKTCWDGTYKGADAQSDSYVYLISFKCYNGANLSKKGTVTVMR